MGREKYCIVIGVSGWANIIGEARKNYGSSTILSLDEYSLIYE